jgi:hypothetical protein
MQAPSPLIAVGVTEFLRMWKDNRPTDIRTKPLPDIDALNSQIPEEEWELGLNREPVKPWQHYFGVYLVNATDGSSFRYENSTWGCHQAVDELKEAVITMRMLRGNSVVPLVNLSERPRISKKYGKQRRPHFEIIGWKTLGGDPETVLSKSAPAQLPSPTTTTSSSPTNNPTQASKPKPPVKLTNETLDHMGNVKPVTTGEILDDELPW